jgi:hypothetical protein
MAPAGGLSPTAADLQSAELTTLLNLPVFAGILVDSPRLICRFPPLIFTG